MAFFVVISLAITVPVHRKTKMPCHKVKIVPKFTVETFQCDSGTQFCCDEGCCQKPPLTGFFAEIPAEVWAMVPIVVGILIGVLIVYIYNKCCGGQKNSNRTREPLFGDNSNNVVISQHQEIDNTPLVALRPSNEVPYLTRELSELSEDIAGYLELNLNQDQEVENTPLVALRPSNEVPYMTRELSEDTAGYLELNLNQDQVQEVDNTPQLTPPPSYETSSRREPLPEYNALVLNQNEVQEIDNTSHLIPPPSYETVVNTKDKD